MFGGPPPELSPEELKEREDEATSTVKQMLMNSVLLYLSPFAIDFVRKLF